VELFQSPVAQDPVLFDMPLTLQRTFYPLGFALSVETNSEDVLAAAEESWGKFREQFATSAKRIRVAVSDGQSSVPSQAPIVRAQGNLIAFIGGTETFAVGDLGTGFGFCWAPASVACDREFFRYHYLDALVLTLLDAVDVATIHAGCVALDGRGVLLCGESTAGKSTLAYACARQGWEFLCDDASALVRNRSDRTVVGNPYRLRLRPDTVHLFPELEYQSVQLQPNGKLFIDASNHRGFQIANSCQIHAVAFLDRTGNDGVGLTPVKKESALDVLAGAIAFGSTEDRQRRLMAYRNLLDVPTVRLRYGDLDGAVGCLADLVR
jgi:hypothetical protein